MGFAVDWEDADATATIHNAKITVVLRRGDDFFTVNGVRNTPDVPPQIVNGRFMLPLRAVAEAAGADVFWDGATSTVIILHGAGEIEYIPVPEPEPEPEPVPAAVRVPIPADRRMTNAELAAWTAEYHASGGPSDFEQEVFRLANIERAAYGLPPLVMNDTLMISARFKSQAMSDMGYFSHTNPVYGAFQNIPADLFGYNFSSFGENIARGQRSPEQVVNSWMNSPGHRGNILTTSFSEIGIGFYNNHWTQHFGTPR